MPPAENPFNFNEPATAVDFFGRQDIIQAVEATLRYPTHNSVVLYGPRNIGKTSLLRQLARRLPNPPFFAVYFDLAPAAMRPVWQVLFDLAAEAARNAAMPPPAQSDFKNRPEAFDRLFLPALAQHLGHRLQPVFLLDEFEPVDIPEFALPEDSAVRNLDTYLKELLTRQTYADFVFSAGRRMPELSGVVDSDFRFDLIQHVPVLPPDDARAFLSRPGAPALDDDALARLLALTRGHPYLLQRFGHALFAASATTGNVVKIAAANLLDTDAPRLDAWWASIPPAERLTLAALAAQSTGPGNSVSRAAVESALTAAEIPLTTPGLQRAPENLVNWQVLEQRGDGYTFFVEYFRRWVARHHPLEQIKEAELGRLDPRAGALYLAGWQAWRSGNAADARPKLRQALEIDPNHLGAWLLLGQIQADAGQTEAAVESYSTGHKISAVAAAGGLTGALLALAAQKLRTGDTAAARQTYRRVLEIAPENAAAQAGLDSLPGEAAPTGAAPTPVKQRDGRSRRWLIPAAALLILLLLCAWLFNRGAFAPTGTPAAGQTTVTATPTGSGQSGAGGAGSDGETPTMDSGSAGSGLASATPAPASPTATTTPIADAGQPETATATATREPTATPQPFSRIAISGSAGMRPVLEAAANAFKSRQPNVQIAFDETGSQAGIDALRQGNAQLAMISRNLTPAERAELGDVQVFTLPQKETIALITHPGLPVANLSREQAQAVFSGQADNWAEFGGPDAPVSVLTLPPGSDTRAAFAEQIFAGSDADITATAVEVATEADMPAAVTARPFSIGYITLEESRFNPGAPPLLDENWAVIDTLLLLPQPLALDGAAPSRENSASGAYPLARPLNLLAPGTLSPAVQSWIDYLYSPEGQRVIENFRQDNP